MDEFAAALYRTYQSMAGPAPEPPPPGHPAPRAERAGVGWVLSGRRWQYRVCVIRDGRRTYGRFPGDDAGLAAARAFLQAGGEAPDGPAV